MFKYYVSLQQKNNLFLTKRMISEQQDKLIYLQNLIKNLEKATINGSAITMCLLPNKNVHEYRSLLTSQIAQAINIKDKGNRQSVIQSLKSVKQALKDLKKVPLNGLIILSATCMFQQKHTYQKVLQVIEPHRPVTKQIYSCGKLWNFTHIKQQILVNDSQFGFIIIDGNSTLLATLKGSHYKILKEIKSDIMRNHNKGGQSSVRFSRLRDQSRYNFVKICCQQANKLFSEFSQQIQGFIIAGSAGLKHDFIENIELSPSIRQKIIAVLDVAQGSSEGLKQAIFQSKQIILNKTLLSEKEILNQYFTVLNQASDKTTNGWRSVVEMIEIGLAEKVIICQDNFSKEQFQQLSELCKINGCQLQIVSGKSQEGALFVKRYGGISTILRYEFDTTYLKNIEEGETMVAQQNEEYFL